MTKQTFKVGDKVRILNADKICSPSVKLNNGDIFVITGNEGGCGYYQSKSVLNGKYLGINPEDHDYIEKVAEDMAKFKVGDKVRVICKDEFVPYGTVLTVKDGPVGLCSGGNYYFKENDGIILGDDLELVPSKPTKNQRISALESEVEALKAEVAALKGARKPSLHIGKATVHITQETPKLSANEQRKAIIAEAKAFVEDATKRNYPNIFTGTGPGIWLVREPGVYVTDKVSFEINAKKRTVVALIHDIDLGKVAKKAIAKCAPDDVFNADIGKAIALGRALGLDVKRFEQAVKPAEVVVGHSVNKNGGFSFIGNGIVDSVGVESYLAGKQGCTYASGGEREWAFKRRVTIVDDTEAKY